MQQEAERIKQHYESESRKIQEAADALVAKTIRDLEPLRKYEKLRDAEADAQRQLAEALKEATHLRAEAQNLPEQSRSAAANEWTLAINRAKENFRRARRYSRPVDKTTGLRFEKAPTVWCVQALSGSAAGAAAVPMNSTAWFRFRDFEPDALRENARFTGPRSTSTTSPVSQPTKSSMFTGFLNRTVLINYLLFCLPRLAALNRRLPSASSLDLEPKYEGASGFFQQQNALTATNSLPTNKAGVELHTI